MIEVSIHELTEILLMNLRENPGFFGIGINKYKNYSNLNNARKDVEDVLNLLKERYDVSKYDTLFDEKATRKNIMEYFQDLQARLTKQDKLIIYYSGHGYLNTKNRGFWVPHDAISTRQHSLIYNFAIRSFIEDIKAQHILLISDSCFSSTLVRSNYPDRSLEELERRQSRWIIASGRKSVPDGKSGSNSPFTSSVLQVLQENEKEGLNVMLFYNDVHRLTCQKTKQEPDARPLQSSSHDGGQYIFRLQSVNDPWGTILQMAESSEEQLDFKIAMVDKYTDREPEPDNYQEALELGERLEYKREFLRAYDSVFLLKKFCKKVTPYQKEAMARLNKLQLALDQAKKKRTPPRVLPNPDSGIPSAPRLPAKTKEKHVPDFHFLPTKETGKNIAPLNSKI